MILLQDLTAKLPAKLKSGKEGRILGIDVDPTLICRAKERFESDRVTFKTSDVAREELEGDFDLITCFSVTMWIHLNHGDEGLENFIRKVAASARYVLLEPQPWKCYQTAARRMRKLKKPEFASMTDGSIRFKDKELEPFLMRLCEENGLEQIDTFGQTENWKRKLILFKNVNK